MSLISYTPATGVVVTGGASGIGRASAIALAEVGRPVAIWDLDGDQAAHVAADVSDRFGVPATAVQIDLREIASIQGAVEATRSALPSIGGIVHAAGVIATVPVDDLTEESWASVIEVNLRAHAFLVQALLADLREHEGSAVVGVASIDAILGHSTIPAYCASKSGLLGLTRSLADRLAGDGIRANAVCPGYVETPMLAGALAIEGVRANMEGQTLLGRLAQPEEIGRVVRFLLSDDASYITAATLVADGGVVSSQR